LLFTSDAIRQFSPYEVYEKSSGRIFTIYASKNEAVFGEVQTHFRSFRPPRFAEKVLGAISRFMRPKTKLFSVKFRRIFEVFGLQGSKKKFWAQFHDLCVAQTNILDFNIL